MCMREVVPVLDPLLGHFEDAKRSIDRLTERLAELSEVRYTAKIFFLGLFSLR
jgi:hypothetical protein